jgi:signal transduction histidine kinase
VIAIENVRLFKESQEKNHALTEAHAQVTESLERQTATSEILSVISSSPTDAQPVFEAIVRSAVRLCNARFANVFRLENDVVHLVAHHNVPFEALEHFRRTFPQPLSQGGTLTAQAMRQGTVVHIHDVEAQSDVAAPVRALTRSAGYRTVLAVPILRPGNIVGAIGVGRSDVTGAPRPFSDKEVALLRTFADQAVIAIENVRLFKELEVANRELEAASQHKSEFLANMSHELRTPLNAIIGFSEVLTERMFGDLNEKQEEYLKDIYASGTHLLSLINDILDLSKIEAGRMELELTDFDLPQAIDNALILVRERAGRRGIVLEHSVNERLGEIRGDERKIKQVLLNLLSNALKFTPEGGRVEVRAGMVDSMAEISVTDTGVGIAPADQEAVFEEFRQVGTAEKKAEGTGLGLTLCRKFVELHGGRIRVTSQVGVGSTFTFTIPDRRGE